MFHCRGEGEGDIREIMNRRTWKTVDQWLSDETLEFGSAVYREGFYVQNEYVYIGRTNPGKLHIREVHLHGTDAHFFNLSTYDPVVGQDEYTRVTVSFNSTMPVDMGSLDAYIQIKTNVGKMQVDITGTSPSPSLLR
jgi:hypothetical protein